MADDDDHENVSLKILMMEIVMKVKMGTEGGKGQDPRKIRRVTDETKRRQATTADDNKIPLEKNQQCRFFSGPEEN